MRRRMLLNGISTNKFVDLGFPSGLLWATCNVGADSPEEVGLYFQWGDIVGRTPSDGSSYYTSSAYSSTPGASLTSNIPANETYDAARAILGDSWRMPTKNEFIELINNTIREWTDSFNGTGVKGNIYYKKDSGGNKVSDTFIFLPLTGRMMDYGLNGAGTTVNIWASTLHSNTSYGCTLYSIQTGNNADTGQYRYMGIPIRAVYKPMFSITITLTGDSVSSITVTVTDSEGISHSGTTDSNGVVQLSGVVGGSAKVSISGYQLTNSSITVNASNRSFTCGLVPLGVWAYYADGSLKSEVEADSNAIGVAVMTENCGLVLSKSTSRLAMSNVDSSNTNKFNQLDIVKATDLNSAIVDLDGYNNTLKIINHIASLGLTSPAVSYCMSQFDGNGYLGAFGEWDAVYTNLSAVNSMLTKIGGRQVQNDGYTLTSTLYASYATFPAVVDRRNGGYSIFYAGFGYNDQEVRAFKAL